MHISSSGFSHNMLVVRINFLLTALSEGLKLGNFKRSVKHQNFVIYLTKYKRKPGHGSATLALVPTRTYKYFSFLENFKKSCRRTHPPPPPHNSTGKTDNAQFTS